MSEEIEEVNNALIETVTAKKLIKEKLKKAKEELATWHKRADATKAAGQEDLAEEVAGKIRQLELTIAEYEADVMSQEDQEESLKKTIFRLENGVAMPPPPNLPDLEDGDETIQRMENKIFEAEAFNELSDKSREERKVENDMKSLSLDDELEKLKQSMKKKDQ
ncbi:MAG: PspA/IM30 family protein [Candidatus Melainabacteria bacterium]|nr:PspA/IM30 family protein [Candidatus Melainabacteria bacterium]